MRRWLVLALAACGSKTAPPPVSQTTVPDHPAAADPTSAQLVAALEAKGYKVKPVKGGETLVCGSQGCACFAALDCHGPCITLERNLAIFDEARKSPTHPVMCELADTGTLCGQKYFRFEGDIYRLETRYFGADGRLVGQRNATDYAEYCDHQAMVRFEGAVPDCAAATDVTTICTDHQHDHPLPNPRSLVLDLLGAP